MHPPVRRARGVGGGSLEADADERLPDEPADRRPDLEVRVVGGDTEGLEQEAGEREEEEAAEEDPVAEAVAARLVLQRLGRLGRAPVVQAEGPEQPALDGEDGEPDDQRAPKRSRKSE